MDTLLVVSFLVFSHFMEDQFALGSITKDLLAVKQKVKASAAKRKQQILDFHKKRVFQSRAKLKYIKCIAR